MLDVHSLALRPFVQTPRSLLQFPLYKCFIQQLVIRLPQSVPDTKQVQIFKTALAVAIAFSLTVFAVTIFVGGFMVLAQ